MLILGGRYDDEFPYFHCSRRMLGSHDGSHIAKGSERGVDKPRAARVVVNTYFRIDPRIYP